LDLTVFDLATLVASLTLIGYEGSYTACNKSECFRIKMAERRTSTTEMTTEDSNAFVSEGITRKSWNPKTSIMTFGILKQLFNALDRYILPQSKFANLCQRDFSEIDKVFL